MRTVTYKDKSITTIEENELTEQQYLELKKEFYTKPTKEEVYEEIGNLILNNGTKITNITNYYFKYLMSEVQVYSSKWTIKDVFEYKPLLDILYSKTLKNKKVFDSDKLLRNIETAIRIGGNGICRKPTQFPIKVVDEVLDRFNINNNYYDMSCGWGARLTSSLKNKVNYFGTDPNYKLVEKLNMLVSDWKFITKSDYNVDIRCQGSETFIPEWENKMGLCFTSPPYFNLEDYKFGKQSYKDGDSYEQWLSNFLKPTIINCKKYLIDNGYLVINIKDFNNLTLEQDTIDIAQSVGFVLVDILILKNSHRYLQNAQEVNNDENIMVFMKNGFEHLYKKKVFKNCELF